MRKFREILGDQVGGAAIEYALIAALISLAALNSLEGMGDQIGSTFDQLSSTFKTANADN